MSLRFRINLLVTLLSLLFIAIGAGLMVAEIREQIREEIDASNRVTAQLMTAVLFSSGQISSGSQRLHTVHDFLQRLGRVRANAITLLDAEGHARYSSPPSAYKAGQHAPRWFAQLVEPRLPPVRLEAGQFAVLITPDASRSVLDAWEDMLHLGWLSLGFFALVNGLLYAMVSRGVRPVKALVRGFARSSAGDFSVRLPAFAWPEFHAIGQSFNHMNAVLERTVGAERELAENRALTQVIQRHLEQERQLLARELHDEIGQYLTAIQTLAQAQANRAQQQADDTARAAHATIVSAAGHIYDAMHRIIRRLRPMALERMGLADTLAEAVEEWRTLYPQLQIELAMDQTLPRLGDDAEIALYRITQEAVTNAARHARAQHLQITLRHDSARLELCIEDDGIGLHASRNHGGQTGLRSMRERAQGLGGHLQFETPAGGGTRIHATLPYRQEPQG